MKGIFRKGCLLFLCLVLSFSRIEPVYAESEIEEGELYAKAAVLMDAESGRILFGKNQDMILPMASTTKIMTCIIALENVDISQITQISKKAAGMPDVQLNAKEGDYFYIKDLLYSLMLESHNDSAVAIAEAVGGSVEEFASMMNEKAKKIGCNNTYFITPNGLDAKDEKGIHSTTAADLAAIMSYCVNESPKKDMFRKITKTPSYTFGNVIKKDDGTVSNGSKTYSCNNHNAFLQMMEGATSGKTGFTGNAGYCYVGYLERGETHLVAVVLACGWPPHKTRKWSDVKKLMEYGLSNYTYKTIDSVQISQLKEIPVINSRKGLFLEEDRVEYEIKDSNNHDGEEGILMKEGEQVQIKVELPECVTAPVNKGMVVGNIVYTLDGKEYKREEILVKNNIYPVDYPFCLKNMVQRYFIGYMSQKK